MATFIIVGTRSGKIDAYVGSYKVTKNMTAHQRLLKIAKTNSVVLIAGSVKSDSSIEFKSESLIYEGYGVCDLDELYPGLDDSEEIKGYVKNAQIVGAGISKSLFCRKHGCLFVDNTCRYRCDMRTDEKKEEDFDEED